MEMGGDGEVSGAVFIVSTKTILIRLCFAETSFIHSSVKLKSDFVPSSPRCKNFHLPKENRNSFQTLFT